MKKPNFKKLGPKKLDVKTVRLGIAALLVAVAVVVGAIALLGGDSSDGTADEAESDAVALSSAELLARASSFGHPVYWIGPRAGTESYELKTTPGGQVYIRYLTGGAEAGDSRPDFLTVGTYPVPEALKALKNAAREESGSLTLSQHKGFEVLSSREAVNAYVVFDDQPELQIEIFSPQSGEAAELAASGVLKTLG